MVSGRDQIKNYARHAGDSVRRKDDRRKLARQRVEERKKQEKERKIEELKRLKNLKRQAIFEKLKKIQEITGNKSRPIYETVCFIAASNQKLTFDQCATP